jgi:hypothetical protein
MIVRFANGERRSERQPLVVASCFEPITAASSFQQSNPRNAPGYPSCWNSPEIRISRFLWLSTRRRCPRQRKRGILTGHSCVRHLMSVPQQESAKL